MILEVGSSGLEIRVMHFSLEMWLKCSLSRHLLDIGIDSIEIIRSPSDTYLDELN